MTCRLPALLLALIALAASLAAATPAEAAFPGANGRLAYDYGGNIYTINPDGTGLVQLTRDGQSVEPAWSANGKRIAFVRRGFIFVMTQRGKWPRKVTRLGHSYQPAWSPNGKRLVFAHMGNIWVVRAAGGTPVQLTHDRIAAGTCTADPAWSPLGGTIAFTEISPGYLDGDGRCSIENFHAVQIVVRRLKNGVRHTISDAFGPDFTADGRGLVFSSVEDWQDGQDDGNYPGPQFQSADLTGAHRDAYSFALCAEGAPCQQGKVAAAPTSTLASPQGVYVQEFEGQEEGTTGGFCVSTTAGLATGYCQRVPDTTVPISPADIDWQPVP